MGSCQPITRIAIVGAGPSGLAAAKYLLAEKAFDTIDIFEQRAGVGGIWNLSGTERTHHIPIPQTDPRYGSFEGQHGSQSESRDTASLELESPLYDYLETNIPKELMAFSDAPFADDLPLFVGHETVLHYLDHYAAPVRHLIHLNTQVRDIRPHSTSTSLGQRWQVHVRNLTTEEEDSSTYDAVVVANGHYTVPFVPAIPGLEAWHKSQPGTIIHSKAYRKPEIYTAQKVLVIGNSASGTDIAAQIGPHCSRLFLSSRSPPTLGPLPAEPWLENVPEVAGFTADDRSVRFTDNHTESGIDAVIFATGYFYAFPFLSHLTGPGVVVTHGLRTQGLYQHLFYIRNPTLAFPVLNLKVIPFPLAENQAAVLSRVWSGRISLPSRPEMEDWEQRTVLAHGEGKDFHLLKFPKDAQMVNELFAWAEQAVRVEGLADEGRGKRGKFWDKRLVWLRERFPAIKAAYAARGEQRMKVKTVEELGFDYVAWKKEQKEEGGQTRRKEGR